MRIVNWAVVPLAEPARDLVSSQDTSLGWTESTLDRASSLREGVQRRLRAGRDVPARLRARSRLIPEPCLRAARIPRPWFTHRSGGIAGDTAAWAASCDRRSIDSTSGAMPRDRCIRGDGRLPFPAAAEQARACKTVPSARLPEAGAEPSRPAYEDPAGVRQGRWRGAATATPSGRVSWVAGGLPSHWLMFAGRPERCALLCCSATGNTGAGGFAVEQGASMYRHGNRTAAQSSAAPSGEIDAIQRATGSPLRPLRIGPAARTGSGSSAPSDTLRAPRRRS